MNTGNNISKKILGFALSLFLVISFMQVPTFAASPNDLQMQMKVTKSDDKYEDRDVIDVTMRLKSDNDAKFINLQVMNIAYDRSVVDLMMKDLSSDAYTALKMKAQDGQLFEDNRRKTLLSHVNSDDDGITFKQFIGYSKETGGTGVISIQAKNDWEEAYGEWKDYATIRFALVAGKTLADVNKNTIRFLDKSDSDGWVQDYAAAVTYEDTYDYTYNNWAGTTPGRVMREPKIVGLVAANPTIQKDLEDKVVFQNEALELMTQAVETGGNVSYQWVKYSSKEDTTGVKIDGATSSKYSVATDTVGKFYYGCNIVNSGENAIVPSTVKTKVCEVEVKAKEIVDDKAPVLDNITVKDIGIDKAKLSFTADEDCTYAIVCKETTDITDAEFENTTLKGDAKAGEIQEVSISSLKSNTFYNVYIVVTDKAGNKTETPYNNTFTTATLKFKADITLSNSEPNYDDDVSVTVENDNSESNNFTYVWYVDGKQIIDANASTYKVVASDVGKIIKVRVTSDDTEGFIEKITSAVGKKVRADKPNKPALESKSFNYITLKEVKDCEFSKDGENWQDREFRDLEAGEDYVFYARYKENDLFTSSDKSDSETIKTYDKVTFTTTKTDVTLPKANDGTIVVTALGGSGKYEYSKDGGSSWQESNTFKDLKSSVYDIKVRDKDDVNNISSAQQVSIVEPELKVYKFTFNLNYTGATNVVKDITEGEEVTSEQVTRDGYEFVGWYKDDKLSEKYDFKTKVNANTTVYAKWTGKKLTGTLNIEANKEVRFADVLKVKLTNTNNTGEISYQWYREDGKIDGATKDTYTVSKEDIGKKLSVVVKSSIQTGELKDTLNKVVQKGLQAKPNKPTLKKAEFTSVVVNATVGYKYKITLTGSDKVISELVADKKEVIFDGLKPNTKYSVYVMIPESDTTLASESSDALLVTTKKVELDKIKVTKKPNKLRYKVSELLDLTGMEVVAVYNDKSEKKLELGKYSVGPSDKTKLNNTGRVEVKVKYETKETKFFVLVESNNTSNSSAGSDILIYDFGKKDKDDKEDDKTPETEIKDDKVPESDVTKLSEKEIQEKIANWENSFSDINENEWYYEATRYVSALKIMNGVANGKFAPRLDTNRAMMWQIFYNLVGKPQVETQGKDWYSNARQWAISQKITDGENPMGSVTREQVVTMLYRKSGSPKVVNVDMSGFVDVKDTSNWGQEAMKWAYKKGIIKGRDGSKLAPKEKATRAEIAKIIVNYLNSIK